MRAAKFDKIAVGEVTVNFLEASPKMKAKAAFVSVHAGTTHGWTECINWSKNTLTKLDELRACMEADLEEIHFDDGTTSTGGKTDIGHDGLGEALKEGVPQG